MESPFWYFGCAPDDHGQPIAYTVRFLEPSTADLEVNNHALPLGLYDIQGYDASHLRGYDSFLAALNGQTQNYHNAQVFPRGLSSPLLDLLNARYLIVPAHSDAVDAPALERFPNTVYQDGQVRILENLHAFPRAWIVHSATQVTAGSPAADIASGSIDPRQTALLEDLPPPLESPADPSGDQALLSSYEADRLAIHTVTAAPGLLVLSEVYYPSWKAYVDGYPTHLYVADGALRAVAVPPGDHIVELRFESDTLVLGIFISSLAVLLLALLGVVVLVSRHASFRVSRV
jgi:hypothetical protein